LNSESTIEKCLESIFNNTNAPAFEVIVVDGGSTDKTVELLKNFNVKVISSEKPQSRQRNKGVEVAAGEIIAFADSDVTVAQNWLSTLAGHFDNSDYAGVGGPHHTPDDDPFMAKCIGALLESPLGSAGVRNTAIYKNIREVDHNPPSNSAVRKAVFQEVGGFDPEFSTAEDVTLDAKIRRKGYRLLYDPSLKVWHPQKRNIKSFVKQLFGYGRGRASAFLRYPESLPISYFCALIFTLGVFFTIPLYLFIPFLHLVIIIGWSVYFAMVIIFSILIAFKKKNFFLAIILIPLAFVEHFILGLGFIAGLLFPYKVLNRS